jgi:hypothetical protein
VDEAPFRDFDSAIKRIIRTEVPEKITLQEIREAYGEILRAYNELFPLHPQTRRKSKDETEIFDRGDQDFLKEVRMKLKKVFPKLRETADRSGNAQVWHRGEPLDKVTQGMRNRIGKALRLGI